MLIGFDVRRIGVAGAGQDVVAAATMVAAEGF
jgi:hypothetical protein